MKKNIILPVPVKNAVTKLGSDISDARKRRGLTLAMMAERARINIKTYSKIEQGDASASMAAYANVLFTLGMIKRLGDIADGAYDLNGRMMQDEKLPQRVRLKKDK